LGSAPPVDQDSGARQLLTGIALAQRLMRRTIGTGIDSVPRSSRNC
jgi:hypothetical protein